MMIFGKRVTVTSGPNVWAVLFLVLVAALALGGCAHDGKVTHVYGSGQGSASTATGRPSLAADDPTPDEAATIARHYRECAKGIEKQIADPTRTDHDERRGMLARVQKLVARMEEIARGR